MPFKVQLFQENVERWVESVGKDEFIQACQVYPTLTTLQQKIRGIQGMMQLLIKQWMKKQAGKLWRPADAGVLGKHVGKGAPLAPRRARPGQLVGPAE